MGKPLSESRQLYKTTVGTRGDIWHSAPWPGDYVAVQNIKLRLPSTPRIESGKRFELKPDVLVAKRKSDRTKFRTSPNSSGTSERPRETLDLKLRLRLELDGRGTSPTQDIVAQSSTISSAKVSKLRSLSRFAVLPKRSTAPARTRTAAQNRVVALATHESRRGRATRCGWASAGRDRPPVGYRQDYINSTNPKSATSRS